jgi:hypothetical protein
MSPPAGPAIGDCRLTSILAHYWQNDALIQLLLHSVIFLMMHTPAAAQHDTLCDPGSAVREAANETANETAETEEPHSKDGAPASKALRSVGLPELLDAIQGLNKVGVY